MESKINRAEVHAKFNGHCAYCGCEIAIKDMQVDHIHPKAKAHWMKNDETFSLNHINNLNPACRVCNIKKSSFDIEQFRAVILDDLRKLKDYNVKYRFALRYKLIQEDIKPIVFYYETYGR